MVDLQSWKCLVDHMLLMFQMPSQPAGKLDIVSFTIFCIIYAVLIILSAQCGVQ